MSERFGPETRGIIDAINGLKKPAHENLNYLIVAFDLAVARVDELYELPGWFDHFAVGRLTGSASVRINEVQKGLIDLAYVKSLKIPVRRFYITNVAQAGAELTIGLGGDASFEVITGDPLVKDWVVTNAAQVSTNAYVAIIGDTYTGDGDKMLFFMGESAGVNGITMRISGSSIGATWQVLAVIPIAALATAYAVLRDPWRFVRVEIISTIAGFPGTGFCSLHKLRA
jgi:hypothetical protein